MKNKLAIIAFIIFTIAGCSTLSNITNEGQPKSELVWPKVASKDNTILANDHGIYVDINRIALIQEGSTRDEIYQLIGSPQFSEGFHVREWDYLFLFKRDDGSELACQYKILFDHEYIARSFYWKPAFGKNDLCPPR